MAFGFVRLPGRARRYRNVSAEGRPIGEELSDRQYRAYLTGLGKRQSLPSLAEAQRRVADTEAALERLRTTLAADDAAARVRDLEAERRLLHRVERTASGQRRYFAALDTFVTAKRDAGEVINRRDARSDPRFQEAMKLIRARPNPRGNPSVAQRNARSRERGFALLGGALRFREEYEKRYGGRVRRDRSVGQRMRARNRG